VSRFHSNRFARLSCRRWCKMGKFADAESEGNVLHTRQFGFQMGTVHL
jgi:hypothetical protein